MGFKGRSRFWLFLVLAKCSTALQERGWGKKKNHKSNKLAEYQQQHDIRMTANSSKKKGEASKSMHLSLHDNRKVNKQKVPPEVL